LRQLSFCKNIPTKRSNKREGNLKKRRVLIIVAVGIFASIVAVLFLAKGRRDTVLDGTLQWGFEESAFSPTATARKSPSGGVGPIN